MKELGKRLQTIVDFVKPDQRVADVGCDHAYVSMELAEKKNCTVIAMDIAEGPLAIAKENIYGQMLDKKIETRLSDGLTELKSGEVDAVVIAGMGGHLIVDILKAGADRLRPGMQLVISPHSDLRLVRYSLRKMNIFIEQEACLSDAGKWYFILNCTVGLKLPGEVPEEDARADMLYGTWLPQHPTPEFIEYLEWEAKGLEDLIRSLEKQKTPAARARKGSLQKQLEENRQIRASLNIGQEIT